MALISLKCMDRVDDPNNICMDCDMTLIKNGFSASKPQRYLCKGCWKN